MEIRLPASYMADGRGRVIPIPEKRTQIGKTEYEAHIEECIKNNVLTREDVENLCDEYNLDFDKFLKLF